MKIELETTMPFVFAALIVLASGCTAPSGAGQTNSTGFAQSTSESARGKVAFPVDECIQQPWKVSEKLLGAPYKKVGADSSSDEVDEWFKSPALAKVGIDNISLSGDADKVYSFIVTFKEEANTTWQTALQVVGLSSKEVKPVDESNEVNGRPYKKSYLIGVESKSMKFGELLDQPYRHPGRPGLLVFSVGDRTDSSGKPMKGAFLEYNRGS